MPIYFNDKSVIPAPFVSFHQETQTTEDGTPLGPTYVITLKGKIVVDKGSPNSSGGFWTVSGYPPDEVISTDAALASMLRKQEALRGLFDPSNDGKVLSVQPLDGSTPLKCNPRIKNIDFPEGLWVSECDYTITMEADSVSGLRTFGDTSKVSSASEDWSIESADEYGITFRLTHALSAKGKRLFDPDGTLAAQPWANAQDYVLNQLGLGLDATKMVATGVLDGTSLGAYNYLRSQNVNELAGTFSVNETWLCFDPQGGAAAVEEFTVDTRVSNEDGRTTVSIQGTITGLEERNNTTHSLLTTRYDNASSKYSQVSGNMFSRVTSHSGATLNPTPLFTTNGRNDLHGVITYNYEYNDRPAPSTAGALSESVQLVDNNPNDVMAVIPIPGRSIGPILQSINTVTERKRSITIEVVMPMAKYGQPLTAEPNTDALVTPYAPSATQVFKTEDVPTWNPYSGRYARNVAWTYQ